MRAYDISITTWTDDERFNQQTVLAPTAHEAVTAWLRDAENEKRLNKGHGFELRCFKRNEGFILK